MDCWCAPCVGRWADYQAALRRDCTSCYWLMAESKKLKSRRWLKPGHLHRENNIIFWEDGLGPFDVYKHLGDNLHLNNICSEADWPNRLSCDKKANHCSSCFTFSSTPFVLAPKHYLTHEWGTWNVCLGVSQPTAGVDHCKWTENGFWGCLESVILALQSRSIVHEVEAVVYYSSGKTLNKVNVMLLKY